MIVLVVCMTLLLMMVDGMLGCHLPQQWSGKWFQSKEMDSMSINKTSFLNRGLCLDQKQDKFLFYERFPISFRILNVISENLLRIFFF